MHTSSAYTLAYTVFLTATLMPSVTGHGQLTYPLSSRNGGDAKDPNRKQYRPFVGGGHCQDDPGTLWFTTNTKIPGPETLPLHRRTVALDAAFDGDFFLGNPWRAPGTAAVKGSGCGVAGGGDTPYINGAIWNSTRSPAGVTIVQGQNGLDLPAQAPVTWTAGSEVEVAWSMSVNHGGGYVYRLCKNEGNPVNEECFQNNVLEFSGDMQWLLYSNGTQEPFPMTKVSEGTHPVGSVWARNPIPECMPCTAGDPPDGRSAYEMCGAPLDPVPYTGPMVEPLFPVTDAERRWDDQADCTVGCFTCTQFPPGPGMPHGTLSGNGEHEGWDWSLMDRVKVPESLQPGSYLLSWRWDAEQSAQVWQNCADIQVVAPVREQCRSIDTVAGCHTATSCAWSHWGRVHKAQ